MVVAKVWRELRSLCSSRVNFGLSFPDAQFLYLSSIFRSWNRFHLCFSALSFDSCSILVLNPYFIMPKEAYYAVARGRITGIFRTWDECKAQVDKFTGARYKKFPDSGSAAAFIAENQASAAANMTRIISKPRQAFDKQFSGAAKSSDASKAQLTFTANSNTYLPATTPIAPNPNWKPGLQTLRNPKPVSTSTSANYGVGFQNVPVPSISVQHSRSITTSATNSKRHMKVTEDRVVGPKRRKVEGEPDSYNLGVDLNQFKLDEEGYVIVYTDGACTGNGKKGAAAGIGVWFGDGHSLNISEPVKRGRQTNNVAEIQAAERAISQAKKAGINKLNIKTDSQFTINCITKWVNGWIRNNWKLKSGELVKNKDDLEKLIAVSKDVLIKWSYVAGHKGEYGNEQADQLAVQGARSCS